MAVTSTYRFAREYRPAIRQRTGYLLYPRKDFASGAALASSTTTTIVADVFKLYSDNELVGRSITIYSGAGVGQTRYISMNEQSSGTVTVEFAFTVNPDTTSLFEVWPEEILSTKVNDKINQAILELQDIYNVGCYWTGMTIDDSSTRMRLDVSALSPQPSAIYAVGYLDEDNNEWISYASNGWKDSNINGFQIIPTGLLLLSNAIPTRIDVADVILRGYRLPTVLSDDTTYCDVPGDYLATMAAFLCDVGGASGPVLDPEQHAGRARNWLEIAMRRRMDLVTKWHPDSVPFDS